MKKTFAATASKSSSKKLQIDKASPKFSNTIEKQKKENQPPNTNLNINHNIDFMLPNSLLSSLSKDDDLQFSQTNKFPSKEILCDTTQTFYG